MGHPDIMSVSSIYDAIAKDFERHATESVYNAYYDRPAVLSLLPPVQGQRVLDIGCGPGLYAVWLIEHGAQVMIHYVTARVAALREVARVLTTDGCLIVSTQHPFADWKRHGGSYFATELVQDTWFKSSHQGFTPAASRRM